MDSGFGDDEAYTVYDKPWRDEHTVANNIYRPSKKLDSDLYGDDLDTLMKNKRSDMDLVFLLFLNRYWNSHLYKPYVQGFWLTAFNVVVLVRKCQPWSKCMWVTYTILFSLFGWHLFDLLT